MQKHPLSKEENKLNFRFSTGERITATESQTFSNHCSLDPFLPQSFLESLDKKIRGGHTIPFCFIPFH